VPDPTPPLLHLALAPDWEAARHAGEYRVSTRGLTLEQQGFVHLSFAHQLRTVAESFYRDAGELVVLEIDPALLSDPVVVEPGSPDPGADLYPHLYGPVPLTAVIAVRSAGFDEDGRFTVAGTGV
jgi:uncharacterized protein (DUF952 family)